MNFTTDKNGFIRLNDNEFFKSRIERLEKIFGVRGTMPNWYPSENNPDYEKYPYKNFKGKYVDAYTACPAEVFGYRYFKKWITMIKKTNQHWIRFSYMGHFGDESRKRFCKTLCVYNIEWVNHPYRQIIKVNGLTPDGQLDALEINIDNLYHIAIKVCSEAESGMLYAMLNSIKPEPNIPLFKLYKDYYSNNYDKYIEDCKLYNIEPIPESLVKKLSCDIVVTVSDGMMGGENDDTYIVNERPED